MPPILLLYLITEYDALEKFWPFDFCQKLIVLRFFTALLSRVYVQAEISMERCYQPHCVTIVLSSELQQYASH